MREERFIPSATQLSAMGMEMCCIYLALNLVRRFLGLWSPVFILIFLSYLLCFLLQLTLSKRQGVAKASKISTSAGVVMVAIVAALALWERFWRMNSWRGEDVFLIVLQVGLAGFCCWLGSALLRYGRDYREACGRFQIWLLVLFALASIDDKVYPAVPVFFLLAYLSLALSRWEGSISGTLSILKPYPWRVLFLGAGGVFLAGGLLSVALSPGLVQAIMEGLRTVGTILLRLLEGIHVPERAGGRIDIGPVGCSMRAPKEAAFPASPPPWGGESPQISPLVLWFLLLLLVVSVLCLVFFTVKKLRARAAPEGAAVGRVETFRIPTGLIAAAAGLLRRLLQVLRRWLARISRLVISIKSGPQRGVPLSLRTLYLDLLKWGARQGLPRSRFQTPLEYLKTVSFNFPDKERELSFITEAYLQARYSRNPPGEVVVEAAREAWRFVKAAPVKRTGRGLSKEKA